MWLPPFELNWGRRNKPEKSTPATKETRGYRDVVLISPDRKKIRHIPVRTSKRLSDAKVHLDLGQKEIKDLLSKGWRVYSQMKRPGNQLGQSRSKWLKERKKMLRKIHKDAKKDRKFSESAQNTDLDSKDGNPNSFNQGRLGPSMPGEALDLDIRTYAPFISALATTNKVGGGSKTAVVGRGIQIKPFMQHFLGGGDFEPYLSKPILGPLKDVLLSVDHSGSCSELIPITRALGKMLAKYPEISLDYSENFNGHLNFDTYPVVAKKLESRTYDLILYFGDQDVYNSYLTDVEIKLVALLEESRYMPPEKLSYIGTKDTKNSDFNYFGAVNFRSGHSMAEELQSAISYFMDIV